MNEVKLRGQSLGLLTMLAVQFILGMILNLFVELPKDHSGTSGGFIARAFHGFIWAISTGGGIVLTLHVIVAIGLLIGSLVLVVRSLISKSAPWIITSIIGALGVITALTNGLAFIGYNSEVTSFVMAIGFMVAVTSYSYALSFAINPITRAKIHKTQNSKSFAGRFHHSHS